MTQLPRLLYTTERKLLIKIDCRLVPSLAIIAALCFLDRTNVGNALVYGMQSDLHLSNLQYSTALVMFYITYILFEIPANILLKKLTPRVWLSFGIFMFGAITLCTGFVHNYASLLCLRFLLGLAEAGIFPGCAYLMSTWYTRRQAQRRFSLYLSSIYLSSAFGGLLAAAIGKMNGLGGLQGWRWIFVLEGALTCLVAVGFYFLMANFPEDTPWLTDEEREFIIARLKVEQGNSDVEHSIRPRDVWTTLKDPKVLIAGLIHLSACVPGYMGAYFAPVIVKSLGVYSPIQTQLHTVPIWIVAYALSLAVAFASDKLKHRYFFSLFGGLVSITGYSMLFKMHHRPHIQYGASFLAFAGIASLIPIEICWAAMNLGGHRRRAVGTAWQVAFGNIGGMIAPFAFREQDSPEYRLSYALCISFSCLATFFCSLYAAHCWRENCKRAAQGWGEGLTESEKTKLADLSPSYKFMI